MRLPFIFLTILNLHFVFLYSYIPKRTYKNNYTKVVFLTGAAGFIGSNFLRYMFDKYPNYYFLILDALTYAGNLDNIPDYIKQSPRFEFWYGSVTNQDLVDQLMKQVNFVVHFAAESHVTRSIFDNKQFIETDMMGTQVMMNSLIKHKNVERFIHISTSEVYGTAESDFMDENHSLNPRSPYAAAKTGADRLVFAYCCTYNIPAVIIRPFNNYGPHQHIEKLIPRFITNAIKKEPLTIHGDGSAQRDWIHVLDTSDGIDRALHLDNFTKIKHEVINLGSSIAISVLEIANMIINYFNLPQNYLVFIGDRPGQVSRHIANANKAERLLGWKARYSLETSIAEIIEWYKQNQSWWKKMELIKQVPIQTFNHTIELH